jgi:site-specific recombinase XerD
MDSSERRTASSLPLDRLVAHALGELEKLRYSRRSLRRYRTVWGHLVRFSREMNLGDEYSEHLVARFVDACRLQNEEHARAKEEWRRHVAFLVKVLGDFARDGRVERSVTDVQRLRVPALMKKPLWDYEQYCRERRHLRASTLRERMRTIAVFLDDLGSRNVTTLDQLQPADIAAFVASRRRLGPRSMSRTVSDVRCFLQFLLLRGILQRDLSQMLPTVRVPRDAAIPSVWEPELVERLLKVVDRSSPRGKRDYAILLLACRLGLRLGDIRTLRLDDLKWDTAAIEITQLKSGAPLCLPMTEEVGEALIDYLKSGRPQTAHRELFLRAQPPFTPFAEDGHFYQIVKYWRELAGIRFRSKQHCGLHSLRHTLATQLLREQTPMHVISEILGHATTASTMIYAKADVESLRAAALNTEELRHGD